MKIFKIGIVDDHVLFAEGISNIIATLSQYKLSFIANSAQNMMAELERSKALIFYY